MGVGASLWLFWNEGKPKETVKPDHIYGQSSKKVKIYWAEKVW